MEWLVIILAVSIFGTAAWFIVQTVKKEFFGKDKNQDSHGRQ